MAHCLTSFLAAAVVMCGLGWTHVSAYESHDYNVPVYKETQLDQARRLLKKAEEQKYKAHAALQAALQSSESLRSAVELKKGEVEKLHELIYALEKQKEKAYARKEYAYKAAEEASELEESTAKYVENLQEQAEVARKLAAAKAYEADQAWAAANTAQQSADYPDAPYILNLVEEARLAEKAALDAKHAADYADEELAKAESEKTMAWIRASSAFEERSVAEAVYDAKCEALANAKAAFDKARSELVVAEKNLAPVEAKIKELKSVFEEKAARVKKLQEIVKKLEAFTGKYYTPHNSGYPDNGDGKETGGGNRRQIGNRDENGDGKRRRKGSSEESGEGNRRRKGSSEESGEGNRRRKGSSEESGEGNRRRKGSSEESGEGNRRRKGSSEESGEGNRRRKGSSEESGEGNRRRKGSSEESGEGNRRRKGSSEESGEGNRRRKGSSEESGEGNRRRKGSGEENGGRQGKTGNKKPNGKIVKTYYTPYAYEHDRYQPVRYQQKASRQWVPSQRKVNNRGSRKSESNRLRYEAAKDVANFFQTQAGAIQAYIQQAVQMKRNAKRVLTQCYAEIESAKSLKAARISEAARMAKELQRLEGEKAAAEAAHQQALHEFNQAKPPHVASAADAARARQQAEAALKRANELSREAAALWAEANAAQQSTKWVPATNVKPNSPGNHHGNQQTAISYGSQATAQGTGNVRVQAKVAPDASKLTERAKAAEYAAAVAQSEAEHMNELARAAEKAARSTWDAITPNAHSYHEADARYNAIALEYSHKKASYDAAVLSVNDATNLIFTKQADIKDAKARIKKAEAKIDEYQTQLNNILVVANYAAGVAQYIKEETYASTTALTAQTAASTVASTVASTTTAPQVTTSGTAPGGAAPLNTNDFLQEMLLMQARQANRGRQSVPGIGTGRTRNIAQRKYAQRVVQDILGKKIDEALRIANEADAKLQAARQAVAAAKHSAHASHQDVESKYSVVAHLRKEVQRLTKEKEAAEYAKHASKKAADYAEHQEKAAAEELEKAKQQVDTMRILVASLIPAGLPQTEIVIVNSNAHRLEQEAAYAENLARQAKQEAHHYEQMMAKAHSHSTKVWIDSSKVFEEHRVKVAVYESKCEALANTKAAYAKANMELLAAKAHWTPKNDALHKAEAYLESALEKAGEYWAVYKALVQLTECPTRIPAVIRLPAPAPAPRPIPAPPQRGGGSSSEENNGRRQVARGATNGGGSSSSEETNRAGVGRHAARAANGGGSSSSEENNGAAVVRQAARGATRRGSSEERSARPIQTVQRPPIIRPQHQDRRYPYQQPAWSAGRKWSAQRAYPKYPQVGMTSGRQQSNRVERVNRDSSEGD
ncbi:plectin-like [Liolophura sinensis]|uniref:plectin-like n=1 Tax=Liolophura sinensis TaxID=3198878 RepID=UPI00315821C0